MEDLIASLSGSHMSQENVDLEMVKAHLARTLVIPASPSSPSTEGGSLPRTRPPSLSFGSMPGFTLIDNADMHQPLPSPTASYSTFSFDASPPSYSTYPYKQSEDEASLSAAFAGDAFAPMWEKPAVAPSDPWRAFQEKNQVAQWHQMQCQQNGLGITVESQQIAQPSPEYTQYIVEDECMDEDTTEAMLDEEAAINGSSGNGYNRAW